MSYLDLFSIHNLALLSDWLEERGELWVDVHLPHGGASSTSYFVRSLHDLRALVVAQEWHEIAITIRRTTPYPLTGRVTPDLIEAALRLIADGARYAIVAVPTAFPSACDVLGAGHTHDELRRELSALSGVDVAIGLDPITTDFGEEYRRGDEMFVLIVTRNNNCYEPYVAEPGRYEWLRSLWSGKPAEPTDC